MWKLLILQKPDSVFSILNVRVKGIESEELIDGFKQMLEMVIAVSFARFFVLKPYAMVGFRVVL